LAPVPRYTTSGILEWLGTGLLRGVPLQSEYELRTQSESEHIYSDAALLPLLRLNHQSYNVYSRPHYDFLGI
jgi:hypothetical protein